MGERTRFDPVKYYHLGVHMQGRVVYSVVLVTDGDDAPNYPAGSCCPYPRPLWFRDGYFALIHGYLSVQTDYVVP